MKICIATMIWKRPEVFRIWATGVQRLIDTFKEVNFTVVVAGSEGDVSRKLVEEFDFHYLETPNKPLGRKANLRIQECRKFHPDYVLFLGSDDLMSNKTFEFIYDKAKKGYDEIASMDLYIYDSITDTMVYTPGYLNHRKGECMAVGRMIRRSVLEASGWHLWDNDINKFLDGSAKKRLNNLVKERYYYYLKENGLFIVDIKSGNNISTFMIRENYEILHTNELMRIKEYKLIKEL